MKEDILALKDGTKYKSLQHDSHDEEIPPTHHFLFSPSLCREHFAIMAAWRQGKENDKETKGRTEKREWLRKIR